MARPRNFKEYVSPTEMISPIDLVARRSIDPFFLATSSPRGDGTSFVQFYASSWAGEWVKEERGHGHGSHFRRWSFRGWAQVAIGGTIDKVEWNPWAQAEGEFVEGNAGVILKIRW
jgi:hypothetical protein